jgi:hypothetical protein
MTDRLQPLPAASAAPADWLFDRVTFFGEGNEWPEVTVGPGFEAYARVFHPVDEQPGAPRWADIAAAHGWTFHASADWEQISRPRTGAAGALHDAVRRGSRPAWGNLVSPALGELCNVLARHTSTPGVCWFAVWEGWGWGHPGAHAVVYAARSPGYRPPPTEPAPVEWQLDRNAPAFDLPARRYHLYGGAVQEATHIGYWQTREWFSGQSPSLFWPDDHAWCVSTEVDYDSTFVGGSADLVEELIASQTLEVLSIAEDAPAIDLVNV